MPGCSARRSSSSAATRSTRRATHSSSRSRGRSGFVYNFNFSYFNDPSFNRKLKAAAKLSGARRYRTYSRLALELERDGVPGAAIETSTSRDFFSARIGCQVYQPVYGMDLAALCLQE